MTPRSRRTRAGRCPSPIPTSRWPRTRRCPPHSPDACEDDAHSSDCYGTVPKGKQHKGTWTSVYDEGFEVDVSDRHFFAFSHFANGRSQCKQTYPGWHRDAENPDKKAWGCYTGEKQSEKLHEEHLSLLSEEERAVHEDSMNLIEITEEDRSTIKAYDSPDPAREKLFEPEHELVKRINAKATTWKAKVHMP